MSPLTPVDSQDPQIEPSPSSDVQNARAANSKAPILRLPTELIGEISLLAVYEYIREDNQYRHPAALTLSAVCYRWRAVSLAQPELWAHIPLRALRVVTLFISRCQGNKLSLYMFRSAAESGCPCVKTYYRDLASLLRGPSVSARIRKLVLRNQRCAYHGRKFRRTQQYCPSISLHLLPLLGNADFPALRSASFFEDVDPLLSGKQHSGTNLGEGLFAHCPDLRRLNMFRCRLRAPAAYTPLLSLQRLEFSGSTPSLHYRELLDLLKKVPQLHALHTGCRIEHEDDEWLSDIIDTADLLPPPVELVYMPNLRELSVVSAVDAVTLLVSHLIYPRNARVRLEIHPGDAEEDDEFRAALHHLIPPACAGQYPLPNFSLSLDEESLSISSLDLDSHSTRGAYSPDPQDLEVRRLALRSMLRGLDSWKNSLVTGSNLPVTIPSPAMLLQDRQSHPQKHFTLRMFTEWEDLTVIHDILAREIPTVSNFKLVVGAVHGGYYSLSDEDSDEDPYFRTEPNAQTKPHKWGIISDTFLPQAWLPVERLQVETNAIPSFVKALLAIPDDPAKVLPALRDLRGLDVRGMRNLDSHIDASLLDGLQRRAAMLGPLEQLCLEDVDFAHEELEYEVERLQACVLPGGLRIRTLHDAREEKELDCDASIYTHPRPRHNMKW